MKKSILYCICFCAILTLCACSGKNNNDVTVSGNTESVSTFFDVNVGNESTQSQVKETDSEVESSAETVAESIVRPTETQKPTEKETQKPTEKATVKQTQVATASSLTKSEAVSIAKMVISKYETYRNMGICCDYEESYENLTAYMPEQLKPMANGQVKCLCCKTTEDAQKHIYKYLDKSLEVIFSDELSFKYKGSLYFIMGAVGFVEFESDKLQLISYNNNSIVAKCNMLNSGGVPCGTYEFTLTKKNGSYLITKIVCNG